MATRRTRNLTEEEGGNLEEASEHSTETKTDLAGEVVDAVRSALGSLLGSGELVVDDAKSAPKSGSGSGTLRQQEEGAYETVVRALRDVGLGPWASQKEEKAAPHEEPEKPPEPKHSRLTRALWGEE